MSVPIEACGSRSTMRVDQAAIVAERIRPAHQREHPIARVLQRQVEMRREAAAARGDEIDDLRRAIHRLERADPERHVGRRRSRARAAVDSERARRRQVAPVRAEVDAGQRDLLEAGGRDALDLAKRRRQPAGCGRRRASSE